MDEVLVYRELAEKEKRFSHCHFLTVLEKYISFKQEPRKAVLVSSLKCLYGIFRRGVFEEGLHLFAGDETSS